MKPHPEIPEPPEAGSSGLQEQGKADENGSKLEVVPATAGPVAEAVQGLASSRARSLGGEVSARLIAGSFAQLSHDLERTREALRDEQKKSSGIQSELATTRTRNAVLTERIQSWARLRHFSNLGITIGSIMLAASFELQRHDRVYEALAALGIGILLIVFAWFTPSSRISQ